MHPKFIARWKELTGAMLGLLSLPPLLFWYLENGQGVVGAGLVWLIGIGFYAVYAAVILWLGARVWRHQRRLEGDNRLMHSMLGKLQQNAGEDFEAYLRRLRREYEGPDYS